MTGPDSRRAQYLCLQPTREGQGSHAHVWGLVGGLEGRGWEVLVHQPPLDTAERGLLGRILPMLAAQVRLLRARHRGDVLYVRMHPMAAPLLWVNALSSGWGGRGRAVVEVNGPEDDWVAAWPALGGVEWLLRRLIRTVLRRADAVVVVTEGRRSTRTPRMPSSWVRSRPGRGSTTSSAPSSTRTGQPVWTSSSPAPGQKREPLPPSRPVPIDDFDCWGSCHTTKSPSCSPAPRWRWSPRATEGVPGSRRSSSSKPWPPVFPWWRATCRTSRDTTGGPWSTRATSGAGPGPSRPA